MARLERRAVAARRNIKDAIGTQDSVGVPPGTAAIGVDIGNVVLAVPEYLQKAEHLGRLNACETLDTKSLSELSALDQSTVLALDGEEARAGDFLPKVKAGLVPAPC